MTGDMADRFGSYSDTAGIIPRVLYQLFTRLGTDDSDSGVKCSFIELYNEELRDLLSADEGTKVKIFEDSTKKGAIVIQGMEESFVKSAEDGVKLLQDGSHKRQVAATKCNDLSSRSHTVFTITVHVKVMGLDGEDMLRTGKLNLVDLAGSENIGRSGAENKRAREAGMINQSLLTLGRVINALVDKSPHIPYRFDCSQDHMKSLGANLLHTENPNLPASYKTLSAGAQKPASSPPSPPPNATSRKLSAHSTTPLAQRTSVTSRK